MTSPPTIRICAVTEAPATAEGWATHAISLLDPARSSSAVTVPPLAPRHLILAFDDIERPTVNTTPPAVEHIDQVLAFTRDLTEEDRLLIHCHAGISRSPAIAISVLVQQGSTAAEAVERVAAIQPDMMPNLWLCRHADAVLRTGGAISKAVKSWLAAESDRLSEG